MQSQDKLNKATIEEKTVSLFYSRSAFWNKCMRASESDISLVSIDNNRKWTGIFKSTHVYDHEKSSFISDWN